MPFAHANPSRALTAFCVIRLSLDGGPTASWTTNNSHSTGNTVSVVWAFWDAFLSMRMEGSIYGLGCHSRCLMFDVFGSEF